MSETLYMRISTQNRERERERDLIEYYRPEALDGKPTEPKHTFTDIFNHATVH